MNKEIDTVSQLDILKTVHRCKSCNTETDITYEAKENHYQLFCGGCRIMEFIPRSEIGDMKKHFKTELYLADQLVRVYE